MNDLDRILLTDDKPEPSAGFTAAVMEAVRREEAGPPPIPFPWWQFALGFLLLPVLAGLTLWQLVPQLPVPLQVGLGRLLQGFGAGGPELLWALSFAAASSIAALWCYELVGGAE